MDSRAFFLDNIHSEDIGYYEGKLIRQLWEPLIWVNGTKRRETPSGFQTDGASVPRVPIIYDLWGDRVHREAVGHDDDYCTDSEILIIESEEINLYFKGHIPERYIVSREPATKEDSDWYFRITMKDRMYIDDFGNIKPLYSSEVYTPMYLAVRACGGPSFHKRTRGYKFPCHKEI